ncbi:hypothetical protein ACIRBX_23670 [Kitasatospora sp. NPDC096147]|uniref:hypothetical protein n=1 Tax=Kitasatospora sp. NPDC096147 TaxID=3364093 RepID=UPI00382751F4
MIETIVAVVGAVSTLAGVAIGIAGYRSQAALVRLQTAQLRQQSEDAERARRLAEAAERRAQAAEHRAVEAGRQRAAQEEGADRARERQLLLVHARHFTVEADGGAVRAGHRGRFPVTDVRVYWRGTDITPGGLGLDLSGPTEFGPEDPRAATVVAAVPGLSDGARPAFADIHVDFTDVQGRRWRRRGNGALLLRGADGAWDSAPTAWLDEEAARTVDPRPSGPESEGYPVPHRPQPGRPVPHRPQPGRPAPRPPQQTPWVPAQPEPGTAPVVGLPAPVTAPPYGRVPLPDERPLRKRMRNPRQDLEPSPAARASAPPPVRQEWAQPVAPEHLRSLTVPLLALLGVGLGLVCLVILAF